MNKRTRLIALLLSLIMLIGCLASCDIKKPDGGEEPGGDVQQPEEQSKGCVITTETVFTSENEDMKAAIEKMDSSLVTYIVDGKTSVVGSASVGGTSVSKEYIMVDGVLYAGQAATSEDYSVATYKKAALTTEDAESFLEKVGATSFVDLTDFGTHAIDKRDNVYIYDCTEILPASLERLEEAYLASFATSGAKVEILDAHLVIEKTTKQVMSKKLTISFVISMYGENYDVIMTQTSSYAYEQPVSISLPENIDEYIDASYEEILK